MHKIKKKKSGIKKENNENIVEENSIRKPLISFYNSDKKINNNISFLNLVFILSYWILIDHITKILESLIIFDYWMFELLCISLIASKLLKIEIYNHQKLGIIINSVSCLILGIIRFFIFNAYYKGITNNKDDKNTNYFCIEHKWFIPISILTYLFIINSTSYVFTKLKFYMDLKFISQTKLLILYGFIGFVFSTIACIIETLFKCVGSERDFFCKIKIYESESDDSKYDSYIEHILVFFEDFSKLNKKDFIIEIFIYFFEMIFYYCSLYFDMLVIYYLSPMHFIFSNLIHLFFNELRLLIINIIGQKDKFLYNEILLNISMYILSLIGFMIYLEIIELNFCNLNYNLRKYIDERSIRDTKGNDNRDSIIYDYDEDEEDKDNDNNRLNIEFPINK